MSGRRDAAPAGSRASAARCTAGRPSIGRADSSSATRRPGPGRRCAWAGRTARVRRRIARRVHRAAGRPGSTRRAWSSGWRGSTGRRASGHSWARKPAASAYGRAPGSSSTPVGLGEPSSRLISLGCCCACVPVPAAAPGCRMVTGPGPAIACHSSVPHAVLSIVVAGGSLRSAATRPSRCSTTWSPGSSPQSSALQTKPLPDLEHFHADGGQYLEPRVMRASGKSEPAGSVMRWVSEPRPKRCCPVMVNSKNEQLPLGSWHGSLPVAMNSRYHIGGAITPGHWPSALTCVPLAQQRLTG